MLSQKAFCRRNIGYLCFLLGEIFGIFQDWTRSRLIVPYFFSLQRHPFFLKAVATVSWCYFHLLQIWVRRESSQLAFSCYSSEYSTVSIFKHRVCVCVCIYSFFHPNTEDNGKISQIKVMILEDIKILF